MMYQTADMDGTPLRRLFYLFIKQLYQEWIIGNKKMPRNIDELNALTARIQGDTNRTIDAIYSVLINIKPSDIEGLKNRVA